MKSDVRAHFVFIAFVVFIALAWSGCAMTFGALWTSDAHMVMEGAPVVVDIDGNGGAEVLTAAYESIIAVDGTGKELWRFDGRGRYQTCPAIWKRDGALPLIYAGDNTGQFTCLDGKGGVVWQADMKPIFCASPAICDLDHDGRAEVVQGDKAGSVTAFDALTGKTKWQARLEGECTSPALADLNGDGTIETVIATGAGHVYAIDAAGKVLWTHGMKGTTPDWATCSPIAYFDSKEKWRILSASGDGLVQCVDSSGDTMWSQPTRGAVASALSAGDLDADGRADLFAVTQLGVVYRFDEDGNEVWEIDTQGRSLAPGAIVDIDGDGQCDYALCTQNGNLLVFDASGALRYSRQFDNRTINVTPAFGDIVRERPGLEFAITGGESGRVLCIGTKAAVNTTSHWASYRGNCANTAAWMPDALVTRAAMSPENLDPHTIVSGDVIRFAIATATADAAMMTAEAACFRPDGSQQRALSRVIGRSGLLDLPLTVTVPGAYRFDWSLRNSHGAELTRGSRTVALTPFANERALAARAVDALRARTESMTPGTGDTSFRAALAEELSEIEKEARAVSSMQEAAVQSGAMRDGTVTAKTAALSERSTRDIELTKLAGTMASGGHAIVPFVKSMWENRGVDLRIPEGLSSPLRICRRCVRGEHEPVAINVFNASSKPAVMAVSISAESDTIDAVALASKAVPANFGDTAWDPLTAVNPDGIEIPPLRTREVWLDIDLANTAAGPQDIVVSFETDAARAEVRIELDVLPFTMAGYDAMRMCCWGQYNGYAVKDLLAHGNTVFITALPKATIDTATSTIAVDFAALDAFVASLRGHDIFLLLQGKPALDADETSDAYVTRLADYLGQVLARLAANGIDEDHVALYTFDEPGGAGWNTVHQYTAFARQALRAHPGLKLYVNGGGDLAMFEEMAEWAGVWSPSYYMLADESPEMAVVRKSGKTLWSYDCGYSFSRPVGANTKTINIVAQYRLSAVVAMDNGATGIGWWCYNYGPSIWGPVPYEYPLVYQNEDGTVTTSRRWEAVREGVEDARILLALRKKLSDASLSAEMKAKIRHVLEVSVPELSTQTMEEARLGVARYVLDATHNDATVERLRGEMLDCVEALAGR